MNVLPIEEARLEYWKGRLDDAPSVEELIRFTTMRGRRLKSVVCQNRIFTSIEWIKAFFSPGLIDKEKFYTALEKVKRNRKLTNRRICKN